MQPSDINILVVDDDDGLRESLLQYFKALKFTIHTANSGNEALAVLKERPHVHIVLSDIRMAGGSGTDLLREVRKNFHRDMKFYLMTGYDDMPLENAYALGADGFFTKPFSVGTVRDCIQQSFLKKSHLWARRPPATDYHVKYAYPSFLAMANADDATFGRSGAFFSVKFDFPRIGDMCNFQIELQDLKPCRYLSGFGVVRWVRKEQAKDLPSGIGVEICYLTPECREIMITWMESKKDPATIPLK